MNRRSVVPALSFILLTLMLATAATGAPVARTSATLPPIASVTPDSGPAAGGQPVVITGPNLAGLTGVTFGGVPATIVSNTATTASVITPAHAVGSVDVVAVSAGGSATLSHGYSYVKTDSCLALNAGATYSGFLATRNIASGDFNEDGRPDLAVASAYDVAIMLGVGNGTLSPAVVYTPVPGTPVGELAVGDFNADGHLDVAVGVREEIAFLAGSGGGSLAAAVRVPSGGFPYLLAAGDFNADGVADLAFTSSESPSRIRVMNGGAGGFVSGVTAYTVPDLYPEALTVGDFNRDGYRDLIFPLVTNGVGMLLGSASGTFSLSQAYPAGTRGNAIALGDFNSDGWQDVAMSDGTYSGSIRILLGDAAGGLRPPTSVTGGGYPEYLAVADFNGDGHDDLAIAHTLGDYISIFPANGSGGFSFPAQLSVTAGMRPNAFAVADWNGDGRLDLAIAGFQYSTAAIVLNGCFPVITGVSPAAASTFGDRLSITGRNLATTTSVTIGGATATDVQAGSTYVVVTTPSHPYGSGDLVVTTDVGSARWPCFFDTPPAISGRALSVAENTPNGTVVGAVTASDPDPGAVLTFSISAGNTGGAFAIGAASGTITVADASRLNYEITQLYSLSVTASDGMRTSSVLVPVSITDLPEAGVILSMTPATGRVAGGAVVTFTGSELGNATSVTFGGAAATITSTTASRTVVTAPAHAAGTVDVVFTTTNGSTTMRSGFTYVADASACVELVPALPRLDFGSYPGSVRLADFNEDGRKDLAVADPVGNKIWIVLARADGSFDAPVSYAQNNVWEFTIADFNGDGHADVAVGNRTRPNATDGAVSILLGTGAGTFTTGSSTSVTGQIYSLNNGDFNADGRRDLAIADGTGSRLLVTLGRGDGTFGPLSTYSVASTPYDVAVGDFNLDGRQDLALTGFGAGKISVLAGNGDGTFGQPVVYTAGSQPVNIAVGDFNSDGRPDLAVANYAGSNISVFLGTSSGTFAPQVTYAVGSVPRAIVVSDFDGDGRQDLVVANYGPTYISLLTGRGDGTFASRVDFEVGATTGSGWIAANDFNGDGRQDVVVTNTQPTTSTTVHLVSFLLNVCVPVVTDFSPRIGPTAGGTVVTISGRHLEGATSTLFGGTAATLGTNSSTSLAVTTPPHAAASVDVVLTTPKGSVTANGRYLYDNRPVIADQTFSVREDAAIGAAVGTLVAADPDPGTVLRFSLNGGTGYGRFALNTATGAITLTSKLDYETGATYTLSVSVSDGNLVAPAVVTINVQDVAEPPVVISVTPAFGPATGGKTVRITGIGLEHLSAITLGGVAVTAGATSAGVTITTPAHAAGEVDLVVTNAAGSTTIRGAYRYLAAASCFNLRQAAAYPSTAPNSVAVADFNRDGRDDFAVGGSASDITVFVSGANGTFLPAWSSWLDGGQLRVVTADFNGDRNPDLLVSSDVSWIVVTNNGSGGFETTANYSWWTGGAPMAADFNGDGYLDVAVMDVWNWGDLLMSFGRGDGTFSDPNPAWIGGWEKAVAADFNRDGRMDVAATASWADEVVILRGAGNGTFTYTPGVSTAGTPGSIAVGDFNGDGNADLVTTSATDGSISVLIGRGDGTFAPAVRYAAGGAPQSVVAADFDGDGSQDLAVANSSSNDVTLFKGAGDGTFVATSTRTAGTSPDAVVAGDFNGDGHHDLAVANAGSNNISLLMNGCVVLTAISPAIGSTNGVQTVTITGAELDGTSSVTFGGAAASIVANTSTSITAITPRHAAGKVDVVVTTQRGSATLSAAYTFDAPPVIAESTFTVTPQSTLVGTSVSASADFADPGGTVHTATLEWGDGTSSAGSVVEAAGGTPARVSATHTYAVPGVFTVKVTVSDGIDSTSALFRHVVVADPNGGTITGGGTIESPPGAYVSDATIVGKATFAINFKYPGNSTVLNGNFEFHFPAASLKFKSATADSLVVAGAKAQVRGKGTVNGSGDYTFIATAASGQPGGGADKLRVKIWNNATSQLVYDNLRGAADDLSPDPPAISGGSISLH